MKRVFKINSFSFLSFLLLYFSSLSVTYANTCFHRDTNLSLFTQDTIRNKSADTLSEVTIVAKRLVKEVLPVQTLTGNTLKKLNAYSVADAVRYFAGVQIKDYGGIGGLKTVNIRSLGSQHVGVFYDGIQIGNAQNGVVDLGRFSLENMEAVTLYNGQKSAIFQPAKDFASASAMYLHTRVPYFYSGKRYNLTLGIKGGSFGTIDPSFVWEYKLSDKISLSASGEYMYTNGRYRFTYSTAGGYDTTATRRNGDVRMERIEAALFGKLAKGEWKIKTYFYDSQRGYPGASVREEPGKFSHQDRQWDDNFFSQATLRLDFTRFYNVMFNAKYSYDYLHYLSDPRQDVTTMYVNNHFRQQEIYGSVAHLFNINEWWNLSLSNDYQWNKLNADLLDFAYPVRNSLLTAVATSVSFKRLKVQASLLHTYVKDRTRISEAQAGTKAKFTPSVVVSYKPFGEKIDLSVRAFYKRIFRLPTFNDLYYTFIGNRNLNPEFTTQYDIGITYRRDFSGKILKYLEGQVDGYYNVVDDKIIAIPTSNQFRWTMMNYGHVKIRGIDASLEAFSTALHPVDLRVRVTYTYQKAQDFTDKSSEWYGGQIPYIPWHSGTALATIDYRGWSLNYSFIYTGERYESVANIPENYALAWYTSDVGLSKAFDFKKFTMRATLEVNNIFNQQYEVVQCYPMPGTNFKIKLNFLF